MSIDKQSTYYDAGGIETLKIIQAKVSKEMYQGYLLGNIIKYSTRVQFKTPGDRTRDAQKIIVYAKLFLESLNEQ